MSDTLTIKRASIIIASATRHGHDHEQKPLAKAILVIAKLSPAQKFILIEHACGPRPVLIREMQTLMSLKAVGLIRFADHRRTEPSRPTHSFASDFGREIAAHLLAELAEALVAKNEVAP